MKLSPIHAVIGAMVIIVMLIGLPISMTLMGNTSTNVMIETLEGSGYTVLAEGEAGGGTPGGADTQVQYNDAGAFGGDSGFTFNETTNTATVGGLVVSGTTATVGGDEVVRKSYNNEYYDIATVNSGTNARTAARWLCDGVDDDMTWEAAIEEKRITGVSGTFQELVLNVAPGSYSFSNPVNIATSANYEIDINGSGGFIGTQVSLAPGAGCPLFVVGTPSVGTITYVGRVNFRNMTLDGNRAVQSGTHSLVRFDHVTDAELDHVFLTDSKGWGFEGRNLWTVKFSFCPVEGNALGGILIAPRNGQSVDNIHLDHCVFKLNDGPSMQLDAIANYINSVTVNETWFGSSIYGTGEARDGIICQGYVRNISVNNNYVKSLGEVAANTYHFIRFNRNGVGNASVYLSGRGNQIDAYGLKSVIGAYHTYATTGMDYRNGNWLDWLDFSANIVALNGSAMFYTNNTASFINNLMYEMGHESFTNVNPGSTAFYLSPYQFGNGGGVTQTITAKPNVPEQVTYTATCTGAITRVTLELRGWTARGNYATEIKSITAASSGTASAFLFLDYIKASEVICSGTVTLSVGISGYIGFGGYIDSTSNVIRVIKNGTDLTVSSGSTAYVLDGYKTVPEAAGTDDYEVWYQKSRNMVDD